MTDFGENIFIIIIAIIIGCVIQFYVIKEAVVAALKEFYRKPTDKSNEESIKSKQKLQNQD